MKREKDKKAIFNSYTFKRSLQQRRQRQRRRRLDDACLFAFWLWFMKLYTYFIGGGRERNGWASEIERNTADRHREITSLITNMNIESEWEVNGISYAAVGFFYHFGEWWWRRPRRRWWRPAHTHTHHDCTWIRSILLSGD